VRALALGPAGSHEFLQTPNLPYDS
jgi:hypothetical protein